MLKFLYYYYYLVYKEFIPEDQPKLNVVFTLGFSYSLIIHGSINIFLSLYNCKSLHLWQNLLIAALCMALVYYKGYMKHEEIIVLQSPELFRSKILAIIVVILFFLTGIFFLFFGVDMCNYLCAKW